MTEPRDDEAEALHSATERLPSQVRRYAVSELFGDQRELILDHDGTEYRLRITSKGRLILTK